jgi:hypothetical protein
MRYGLAWPVADFENFVNANRAVPQYFGQWLVREMENEGREKPLLFPSLAGKVTLQKLTRGGR